MGRAKGRSRARPRGITSTLAILATSSCPVRMAPSQRTIKHRLTAPPHHQTLFHHSRDCRPRHWLMGSHRTISRRSEDTRSRSTAIVAIGDQHHSYTFVMPGKKPGHDEFVCGCYGSEVLFY